MDSFELNKIAAAILIALLVIKGTDLISQHLIPSVSLKDPAYKIASVLSPTSLPSTESKGPTPIEPLLAAANIEQGAEVFKKCASCHTIDKGGANRIGPNLYGIVGTSKATHPSYSYSSAMTQKGGVWSYDDLNLLLYNPRTFVPGTKMSFAGIKDDKERAALIAYLRQQTTAPLPLPLTAP